MNSFNSGPAGRNGFCQDFCNDVKNYISTIPFFVRLYSIILISFYIISLITPIFTIYLINYPPFTILRFQIWRLITSVLISTQLLGIVFGLFFWLRSASTKEKNQSTIGYLMNFFLESFIIEVIFCLGFFIVTAIFYGGKSSFPVFVATREGGLWPILMYEMTVECLRDPDSLTRLFCFPCTFKRKYYPFILFAFFSMMEGFRIDVELLCSIIGGLLFHYYLERKIYIPILWIQKSEQNFLFRWMKNKKGFVPLSNASPTVIINAQHSFTTNQQQQRPHAQVRIVQNRQSNDSFIAFKGKGVKIGSDKNSKNKKEDKKSENRMIEIKDIIDSRNSRDIRDSINSTESKEPLEKNSETENSENALKFENNEIEGDNEKSLDISSTNSTIGLRVKEEKEEKEEENNSSNK